MNDSREKILAVIKKHKNRGLKRKEVILETTLEIGRDLSNGIDIRELAPAFEEVYGDDS